VDGLVLSIHSFIHSFMEASEPNVKLAAGPALPGQIFLLSLL